jgi:X-X-X-Leu-X-X-Gly heptad repeat protein
MYAPCRTPAAGFLLLLAACVGDQSSDATRAFSQLAKAANQFAEQAQQMASGAAKPVPPVSYKTLIDYLPRSVPGMKAGEPKGETGSAGQWQYSQAKVEFTSGRGRRAEVGIYDYAFIPFLYAPYKMALTMKVKREGTDGFERSTEVAGFPAFEQWDKGTSKSEVAVMVGERFVVTADVHGGDEGSALELARRIDLKGLAKENAR